MCKFAALTKIVLALMISFAALLTEHVEPLVAMVVIESIVMMVSGSLNKAGKTAAVLVIFAVGLFGIQLLCGSSLQVSIVSALKMMIMSFSIILMLATTKTQQITAALAKQCHMPYKYAFMVTAVLRFVPDLLKESQAVREAQACRGFRVSGNPLKRIVDYMMIIKPMVFRAITRSEHMAISLEMRGFSHSGKRTFLAETKLCGIDYSVMGIAFVASAALVKYL